jgi:hypothetical protein
MTLSITYMESPIGLLRLQGLAGSLLGAVSMFIFFRGFGFETLTDFGKYHIILGACSGCMVAVSYWLLSGGARGESEGENHGAAA